ncbi:DUF3343 domain-containing protein [Criibacterium bergeronii]|uniref:DUF3343 domain-containing protein n=1 Tax=Criibacterium bergeronii TaxID=1871336 RepID=A0A371INF4_9FIRM|nr:DUF3343 domain-containing protein [Criibacterium bergeronii]MBS6063277.1 DUF3343 domain-containing protein [Peptostreptococcaceae bacterium]RDY22011.1 DUF3343 domain-containing protein [Criibacterium bergeronii]TRW22480.1 DUF3343 domain-containing protein [Criibacterium bergeronii]
MLVISFNSTSQAMKADKFFDSTDIDKMVVPTPRAISQSCGISIRIISEQLEDVISMLEKNEIGIKGIYNVTKDEAQKIY